MICRQALAYDSSASGSLALLWVHKSHMRFVQCELYFSFNLGLSLDQQFAEGSFLVIQGSSSELHLLGSHVIRRGNTYLLQRALLLSERACSTGWVHAMYL